MDLEEVQALLPPIVQAEPHDFLWRARTLYNACRVREECSTFAKVLYHAIHLLTRIIAVGGGNKSIGVGECLWQTFERGEVDFDAGHNNKLLVIQFHTIHQSHGIVFGSKTACWLIIELKFGSISPANGFRSSSFVLRPAPTNANPAGNRGSLMDQ